MMCGLFITSCAIECTCGGWGSTFLVEYKHLSPEKAARIIMIYYVGLTLGRFLSGVLATRLHSWKILKLGQIVLGAALLLLVLPSNVYLCAAGMFLIGLGNGPLFPNFNYLTPGKLRRRYFTVCHRNSNGIGIYRNHARSRTLRITRSDIRYGYFPVLPDTVLCCHDTLDDSCKSGAKEKHKTELIS